MPGQLNPHDWETMNPEWYSGAVTSSERKLVKNLWIITIPATVVTCAAITKVLRNGEADEWLFTFVVGTAVFLYAWLLVYSAVATLRLLCHGTSVLQLSTRPGALGGPMTGTLIFPSTMFAPRVVRLVMTCTHYSVSGINREQTLCEDVLWRDEHDVPISQIQLGPNGCKVPVLFTVPFDLPQSKKDNEEEWTTWNVSARSTIAGFYSRSRFEVPIFRTQESDPSLTRSRIVGIRST